MLSRGLYRLLLWLYPASWRAEYGAEMRSAFAARLRDTGPMARVGLWLEVFPDLLLNGFAVQADTLRRDFRYALRTLGRSTGFAGAAIAVGAIGIGATTAAFTMAGHVLVPPFPYPEQDRLVKVTENFSDASPADWRDWRDRNTTLAALEAYRGLSVDLSGMGEPQRLDGASVTGGMLQMLRVPAALGRVFTADDDREASPRTAILSYGLWQDLFGGDQSIVGRTIRLDNDPYTIIGVMPKGFYFPNRQARIWTTMRWGPDDFDDRRNTYVYGVGRLKPGVPFERAQAELRGIGERISRDFPKELADVRVTCRRLSDEISPRAVLMLKVLMAAAGCVLLIACTNLANLLLARAMARRRELAVRTALGAGRQQLIRQMITESLLLSLAAAVLGWGLASALLPLLVRLVPVSLPIAEMPSVNPWLLLGSTLLVVATGTAFGLVPALRNRRRQIAAELHEGARSGIGGQRQRLRHALVVVEVAGSVVLLVGFGLLVRALWRIQAVDPGFRADHVLTLRTSLPMPHYDKAPARDPFYRHVLDGARALPGVTSAAYISFLPMAPFGGIWPVEIEGHPLEIAKRQTASLRFVTPGFFETMKIPLRLGRDIRESDSSSASYVAVVSQSFVDRYWPGENPLGRRFDFGNALRTVVGVVGNVRVRGLERTSEPQVYLSWQQAERVSPWYAPKDLVVRTAGDPAALFPAIRRLVHEADPDLPISDVRQMSDVVAGETESRRAQLTVLGAFGAVAFLLAAVGIHSLLAFAVAQRTQEIGVRMALGAQRGDILRMTLGEGLRLAIVGIAAGTVLAYGAGRLLESLLAGVAPHDAATFAAATGLALVMTLVGSLAPSLRALRVDPTIAIRTD